MISNYILHLKTDECLSIPCTAEMLSNGGHTWTEVGEKKGEVQAFVEKKKHTLVECALDT